MLESRVAGDSLMALDGRVIRSEIHEQRHLREQRELLHDHHARVAAHVDVPDLTEAQRSARMTGVCRTYARAVLDLVNRQREEAGPPAVSKEA